MNDEDPLLEELVAASRERNITIKLQDIEQVLGNPDTRTAMQTWMQQNLVPEAFLSKEEADLYEALQKSERLQSDTFDGEAFKSTRPILEEDISAAILSLKNSTAVIEKQNDVLRDQWKSLESFRGRNSDMKQQQSQLRATRSKQNESEFQQLATTVEDSSTHLIDRLKALQQDLTTSHGTLLAAVEGELKSNDRLLHKLGQFASTMSLPEFDCPPLLLENIKQLTLRLVQLKVAEIKCRLDRMFLECLENAQDMQDADDQGSAVELQEELDSLYLEVHDVAQMSVNSVFGDLILKEIAAKTDLRQENSKAVLADISTALGQLNNGLQQKATSFKHIVSYSSALLNISNASESLINEDQADRARDPNPRTNATSQDNSAKAEHDSEDHSSDSVNLEQLSRHFGLPVSDNTCSQAEITENRRKQISKQFRKLEANMRLAISAPLGVTDSSYQLLFSALRTETSPRTTASATDDVSALVKEFETLQKIEEGLDLSILTQPIERRTQFLSKWSK